MNYNIFFKTINLKLYIKSNQIQRMQQDDQNTFKKHSSLIHTQVLFPNTDKSSTLKPNLIEKINLIQHGINFILPAFWYQELIRINQSTKNLQHLIFPPFQLLIQFLRLYALQNPSESPFQMNQRYSALSSGFLSDLIEQNNFNVSKTLRFSKLNDLREWNEIQWSLISPQLWNLIENRFHLMQLKKQEQDLVRRQEIWGYQQVQNSEELPCLGIGLGKQWILEKGQILGSKVNNLEQRLLIQISYKRRRYSVKRQQLQKQIGRQLKSVGHEQTNFLLIIGETEGRNSLLLKKLVVTGFFQEEMGFKELIRSLVGMETRKVGDVDEKYYISDQNGERVRDKINTIARLNTLTQQKHIIVSTVPIQTITERKVGLKNTLYSLLSSISNHSYENSLDELYGRNRRIEQAAPIEKIGNSLQCHARELEYECIKQAIRQIGKQYGKSSSNKQQIRSGFKLYNNQTTSKIHQTQTVTNALTSILKLSQPNQQTPLNNVQLGHHQNAEDFRMIESLTTNMDTPIQSQQSQHQSSNVSYQNKRLNRHASKQERKRKSQSYLQKKKRNTVILKDNSNNNKANQSREYKKRVRHCLFHSLAALQQDDQTLAFLISNMNIVARGTALVSQQGLIKQPYAKQQTTQNKNYVSEEKQLERKQHNSQCKQRVKCQNKEDQIIETTDVSLQQMAQMIQHKYDPVLLVQKQSVEEMQKIEFYSEQDPQLMMKKDNQEIKTIVDNSEGPCSQIEKQQMSSGIKRMQGRGRGRGRGQEMQMQIEEGDNDGVKSMTDGLNYMQDNQQTL